MKRLLVLLVVAWLAGPPASHAQSPEAVKALADLVVDDADGIGLQIDGRRRVEHLSGSNIETGRVQGTLDQLADEAAAKINPADLEE